MSHLDVIWMAPPHRRHAATPRMRVRWIDEPMSALEALDARWPDAVIIDLAPPDPASDEGIVATEEEIGLLCRAARRRAQERGRALDIIALLSSESQLIEDEDDARALGADHAITGATLDDVRRVLGLPHGSNPEREEPSSDPDASAAVLDASPSESTAVPADFDAAPDIPSRWQPVPWDEATLERAELRRKLDQARHADYFALLDVSRDAPVEVIAAAYSALRERFEPSRAPANSNDRRAREELAEVLDDAWHVLGNARRRRLYREALTGRE